MLKCGRQLDARVTPMTMPNDAYRILYFSGTGNTHWVVSALASQLRDAHCEVHLLSADTVLTELGYDAKKGLDEDRARQRLAEFATPAKTLVVAYPVYESSIPMPLRMLLPLLPDGQGRNLAVVCTYTMAGGDCCHLPAETLGKRGWDPVLATYVKMPNNVKIPAFSFFAIHNGEELNHFYDSANTRVTQIVDELLSDRKHVEGGGLGDLLLGASQRLGEKFLTNYMADHLFALASCTRCGLCAATCPVGNIDFSKKYPQFGRNCCDCLRCYSFCPVAAIQVSEGTMNMEKYPRYKGFDGWKPPRLRKVQR